MLIIVLLVCLLSGIICLINNNISFYAIKLLSFANAALANIDTDNSTNRNKTLANINWIVSEEKSFSLEDLLTPIIAAGGAIGGGIVGSYFTFRNSRLIEEAKNRIEMIKELEFKLNILEIVHEELSERQSLLTNLFKNVEKLKEYYIKNAISPNESYKTKDDDYMRIVSIDVNNQKNNLSISNENISFSFVNKKLESTMLVDEYSKLSIKEKSHIFKPNTLIQIEKAHRLYKEFNVEEDKKTSCICFSQKHLNELKETIDDTSSYLKNDKNNILKQLNQLDKSYEQR